MNLHWSAMLLLCLDLTTRQSTGNSNRTSTSWWYNSQYHDIFIEENVIENVVCEMAVILSGHNLSTWSEEMK